MRKPIMIAAALGASLLLAGCASTGGANMPVDVDDAEVASRVLENGDRMDEYRVDGQLRMVRITPVRGPAYYLYDRDGDGALDRDDADDLPQVYWKLFQW